MSSERKALMEKAHPELQTFCRSHGLVFEVVDLCWGLRSVPDSVRLEACEVFLHEIHKSRLVSFVPVFVVLLGQRYGQCSLPHLIPQKHFQMFLSKLSKNTDGLKLLNQWYCRDDNTVPPTYVLQPITAHLDHSEDVSPENKTKRESDSARWKSTERKLLQLLRTGARSAGLPPEESQSYCTSGNAPRGEPELLHLRATAPQVTPPEESQSYCTSGNAPRGEPELLHLRATAPQVTPPEERRSTAPQVTPPEESQSYCTSGNTPRGEEGYCTSGNTPRGEEEYCTSGNTPRGEEEYCTSGNAPRGEEENCTSGNTPRGEEGYCTSVFQREVELGVWSLGAEETSIVFVRDVPQKVKEVPKRLTRFRDLTAESVLDSEAQAQLSALRSRLLGGEVQKNLQSVELWRGGLDVRRKDHAQYLESVCEQFVSQLKARVEEALEEHRPRAVWGSVQQEAQQRESLTEEVTEHVSASVQLCAGVQVKHTLNLSSSSKSRVHGQFNRWFHTRHESGG
uniref:Uncharacterized protein n=1 Tax=Knipowitschia caucasica TaxID=637954 RepID=A0AAV2KSS5_KNICA